MRRFGKKSSEAPISDVPNFIKLEAPEQGAIPRIHFDISFGEKVLNFDADAYVAKDLKLGVDIRNTEIKLQVAKERYKILFGEEL